MSLTPKELRTQSMKEYLQSYWITHCATTNSKVVMNLLNVSSYSESALNTNINRVYAIRILPPTNVKAILRYVGEKGEFNVNRLLDKLNIQYQNSDQEFIQVTKNRFLIVSSKFLRRQFFEILIIR